jgi:hypothetical protein
VSAAPDVPHAQERRKLRIKKAALALGVLALAFYFGFIALLVLRSHH